MGFTEVLTLVFICMKLMGFITWSWWLVLLPELFGVVIYLLIILASVLGIRRKGKHMKKHFDDLW